MMMGSGKQGDLLEFTPRAQTWVLGLSGVLRTEMENKGSKYGGAMYERDIEFGVLIICLSPGFDLWYVGLKETLRTDCTHKDYVYLDSGCSL